MLIAAHAWPSRPRMDVSERLTRLTISQRASLRRPRLTGQCEFLKLITPSHNGPQAKLVCASCPSHVVPLMGSRPSIQARSVLDPNSCARPRTAIRSCWSVPRARSTYALREHDQLRFPARYRARCERCPRAQSRGGASVSAGAGTLSHLAGELFKMMTGVDVVHVLYRSL